MQTELRNKLNRMLLKLNRAKTEEDTILLYTILHEDITELLQEVFEILNNLQRLEHSTLKSHYNLKIQIRDDEGYKLFLEKNDLFNELIRTMTQQQIEILDDYEDALARYVFHQEEQAVLASAEQTLTSVKNILKGEIQDGNE